MQSPKPGLAGASEASLRLLKYAMLASAEQRIIPNPRHAKTLTCKTFTQSAMSKTLSTLFFRSGRSRGRIGIANGICQRHMFNIWLEVPTRQAQHVSASLAPCILRCKALSTSRRKPSKSGTRFFALQLVLQAYIGRSRDRRCLQIPHPRVRIFRLGCPEVRLDDVFWHGCKCCHLDSCQTLPLPSKHTLRRTESCACHDFGNGISKVLRLPRFRAPRAARARQHPIPLDSCQMLPLPRKHTLRCTECCACHDFGNDISKVLRLPRFRTPRAARATTSQPFRQLPNATPATQTHTQMHRMLRLPRLRQWHLQSAAPATISRAPSRARDNIHPFRQLPNAAPATQTHAQMHRMLRLARLRQWHLQSAAPATISHAPSRARDNIPTL